MRLNLWQSWHFFGYFHDFGLYTLLSNRPNVDFIGPFISSRWGLPAASHISHLRQCSNPGWWRVWRSVTAAFFSCERSGEFATEKELHSGRDQTLGLKFFWKKTPCQLTESLGDDILRLGVVVGDVKLLFVRMDVDDSGVEFGLGGGRQCSHNSFNIAMYCEWVISWCWDIGDYGINFGYLSCVQLTASHMLIFWMFFFFNNKIELWLVGLFNMFWWLHLPKSDSKALYFARKSIPQFTPQLCCPFACFEYASFGWMEYAPWIMCLIHRSALSLSSTLAATLPLSAVLWWLLLLALLPSWQLQHCLPVLVCWSRRIQVASIFFTIG